MKTSSLTAKVRPVFDPGACVRSVPSLNACLEKGRNTIEDIPTVMHRFSENKIGISSDIPKAFLQVGIKRKDRDTLRFLWKESSGRTIIFRHARVVFGGISSPYLLGETTEHHLITISDYSNCKYSGWVLENLKKSFYVDNSLVSVNNEEKVTIFKQQAIDVVAEGKFDLQVDLV